MIVSQIVWCWKSRLWVRVDFKMESVLCHSRKNPNRKKGKNDTRPLEFLDLSLYSWKCQTKGSFTPGNSTKLFYIPWNFMSKTKNQDPWKFYIIFSGPSFEIPLLFLLTPVISTFYFLIILELPCTQPSPVWMFSGIDHWKSGEKNKNIYIHIYAIYIYTLYMNW